MIFDNDEAKNELIRELHEWKPEESARIIRLVEGKIEAERRVRRRNLAVWFTSGTVLAALGLFGTATVYLHSAAQVMVHHEYSKTKDEYQAKSKEMQDLVQQATTAIADVATARASIGKQVKEIEDSAISVAAAKKNGESAIVDIYDAKVKFTSQMDSVLGHLEKLIRRNGGSPEKIETALDRLKLPVGSCILIRSQEDLEKFIDPEDRNWLEAGHFDPTNAQWTKAGDDRNVKGSEYHLLDPANNAKVPKLRLESGLVGSPDQAFPIFLIRINSAARLR